MARDKEGYFTIVDQEDTLDVSSYIQKSFKIHKSKTDGNRCPTSNPGATANPFSISKMLSF